jgi:hypothetical protein
MVRPRNLTLLAGRHLWLQRRKEEGEICDEKEQEEKKIRKEMM